MATQQGAFLSQAGLKVLRGVTFPSVPANFYVALFTAMPTASDGTGATEVSGGSYARVAIATNTGNWGAPAEQGDNVTYQVSNLNNVAFPTATGSWGTILGVGIYDSLNSGGSNNLWWYGSLSASQAIGNGNTFTMPAGDLTIFEK